MISLKRYEDLFDEWLSTNPSPSTHDADRIIETDLVVGDFTRWLKRTYPDIYVPGKAFLCKHFQGTLNSRNAKYWKKLPISKRYPFISYTLDDLNSDNKFCDLFFKLQNYLTYEDYLKDVKLDWNGRATLMLEFCYKKLYEFAVKHDRLPIHENDFPTYSSFHYEDNIYFVCDYFQVNKELEKSCKSFLIKFSSKFQSSCEKQIANYLIDLGYEITLQKRFPDCKNKRSLPFDVYSESGNKPFIIEIDGPQHFVPLDYWGGKKAFVMIQRNDAIKNQYCKDNNIPLLRIPYAELKTSKNTIESFLEANQIKLKTAS